MPMSSAIGTSERRRHVEHELGLLDRPAELGGVRVEARQPDGAVALQPRGELARRRERRLGRAAVVLAGGRQQRVDARRHGAPAGVGGVHVLGERALVLTADRRHHVARPVARQLGAQHDRAAREVAAEPRGAARDLARRRAPAASGGPRGTSRGGSARPPPWPPRRPPRSARPPRPGAGTRSPRARASAGPSSSTPPMTSSPEAIATSASTPGGTGAGRSLIRSAT